MFYSFTAPPQDHISIPLYAGRTWNEVHKDPYMPSIYGQRRYFVLLCYLLVIPRPIVVRSDENKAIWSYFPPIIKQILDIW